MLSQMLQIADPELALGAGRPSGRGAARWSAVGFTLALLLTGAALAGQGLGRPGIDLGLRLTARLAAVAFLPSYAAGSLVTLFGDRFIGLKRRARALGLAFAAVMTVHLGLIIALCALGVPPSARLFLVFGPGALCAALMAAASLESVAHSIGPAGWWWLRNVAMNYIVFNFIIDFWRREPLTSPRGLVEYLPFAVLAAAAPALRLAAWVKQRVR